MVELNSSSLHSGKFDVLVGPKETGAKRNCQREDVACNSCNTIMCTGEFSISNSTWQATFFSKVIFKQNRASQSDRNILGQPLIIRQVITKEIITVRRMETCS